MLLYLEMISYIVRTAILPLLGIGKEFSLHQIVWGGGGVGEVSQAVSQARVLLELFPEMPWLEPACVSQGCV